MQLLVLGLRQRIERVRSFDLFLLYFIEVLHDVGITFVICKSGQCHFINFVCKFIAFDVAERLVQVVALDGKFGIEIWILKDVYSVAWILSMLLGCYIEKSIVYGEFRFAFWCTGYGFD